jgi:hypothetical protein
MLLLVEAAQRVSAGRHERSQCTVERRAHFLSYENCSGRRQRARPWPPRSPVALSEQAEGPGDNQYPRQEDDRQRCRKRAFCLQQRLPACLRYMMDELWASLRSALRVVGRSSSSTLRK